MVHGNLCGGIDGTGAPGGAERGVLPRVPPRRVRERSGYFDGSFSQSSAAFAQAFVPDLSTTGQPPGS